MYINSSRFFTASTAAVVGVVVVVVAVAVVAFVVIVVIVVIVVVVIIVVASYVKEAMQIQRGRRAKGGARKMVGRLTNSANTVTNLFLE